MRGKGKDSKEEQTPGSSELKKEHKRFRYSDDFFRQVIESLEDYAVFTLDIEGLISSWNSGAERLLQFTEEEIIGEPVSRVFTPEDIKRNIPQKEMNNALKDGRALDERYHQRKDKSCFWASGLLFPLLDEAGTVKGFTKIMRDLTAHKVSEQKLKASREYAESIVETVREPLLVLNDQFEIVSGNKAFFETFRVRKTTSPGRNLFETDGMWQIPELKEYLKSVLDDHISFNDLEIVYNFPGIGIRTVLFNGRRLANSSEQEVLLLLAIEDISHQKEVEESLNKARNYAESIVDTAKEPLIILDKRLDVVSANRSFYKFFKVTSRKTVNQNIFKLGNGQWNNPELKSLLYRVIPESLVFNDFEITHDFPELGYRTMSINARKLYRPGNHTEMILVAVQDITERKSLEEVQHAFIGIASHELKTPVTVIKGYAQILQQRAAELADVVIGKSVERINLQADKLIILINHLLDVSKMQSGKLELQREDFDLEELVHKVADELREVGTAHQIIVKGRIEKKVYADKFRIAQVLTNLVSNAIKYSPNGKKITINLSQEESSSLATVSVKDNGIGILKGEQDKIFRSFSRTESVQNHNYPGMGLGLYISCEIIKEHEGKIWFKSKEHIGSTFYFSIPGKK